MTDPTTLLPAGLRDVLPPDADREARVLASVMACLAANGYERVNPPLIEFEDSLLAGTGADMGPKTFRLMDPASQRMMGVRADMTPQIARIAATRLRRSPRPLRICYAGLVLRVQGSELRPERQFSQVGAELIGNSSCRADAEIILLAARCLRAASIEKFSIDLNLPTLATAVCEDQNLGDETLRDLRAALDRKDAASVADLGGRAGKILGAMLLAAGPQARARESLAELNLPPRAATLRNHLNDVVDLVFAADPNLPVTIDPVENRGFAYQTGVSFTIFAAGARGALGRGGNYRIEGALEEPATGFTLYMDSTMQAVPAQDVARRVFVPLDTDRTVVARLQSEGWTTIAGLETVDDPNAEAARLGCGHVLWDETVVPAASEGTG